MNFLKTLLIIIIAWYVIKYIIRLFSLFLVKSDSQNSASFNSRNSEPKIKHTSPKEKIINKDKGEYVDFEEVK
jgi:hypothetical protein